MRSLIAALVLAGSTASAQQAPLYEWAVTRIIDGDTVEIEAPYLPAPLKPVLSIRVYGVDTPEKGWRGKCDKEKELGAAATKFTTALVESANTIMVEIREWDKFGGRVLGDLWIDGKSLTAMLIENGYAREYYGEAKQSWCE